VQRVEYSRGELNDRSGVAGLTGKPSDSPNGSLHLVSFLPADPGHTWRARQRPDHSTAVRTGARCLLHASKLCWRTWETGRNRPNSVTPSIP